MGTYTKKTTPLDGGGPVLFDGKFLTILRRNADGKWTIWRTATTATHLRQRQSECSTALALRQSRSPDQQYSDRGFSSISADGRELYFKLESTGRVWRCGHLGGRPAQREHEWGEAVNLGPSSTARPMRWRRPSPPMGWNCTSPTTERPAPAGLGNRTSGSLGGARPPQHGRTSQPRPRRQHCGRRDHSRDFQGWIGASTSRPTARAGSAVTTLGGQASDHG